MLGRFLKSLWYGQPSFLSSAASIVLFSPKPEEAPQPSVPSLSLEGVSQMDSILPERLLALVRPAFDLVLRRI